MTPQEMMKLSPEERFRELQRQAREHQISNEHSPVRERTQVVTHSVTLELSDEHIALFNRLFELGIAKSKEQITRAERFPTMSIKSSQTIERHQSNIAEIEHLRNMLSEAAQW